MKNTYTLMFLILMIATSSAQDSTVAAINPAAEYNHTVSIEVAENTSDNNTLDFRYYYLPNMFAYFDLTTNNYIYKTDNSWKTAAALPQYYGGYSLFKNLRVPLRNYNGNDPQEKLSEHKKQYPYVKKSRMAQSMNLEGNTSQSSSKTELKITFKN